MPSRRLVLLAVLAAALLGPAGASPQAAKPTTVDRDHVRDPRPRLGPRRRHGPVGRVRLGEARRHVREDPRPLLPRDKLAPAPVDEDQGAPGATGRSGWSSRRPAPFRSRTRQAQSTSWRPASYALDPTLAVVLNPARPAEKLPGPLTFSPGKSRSALAEPVPRLLHRVVERRTCTVVNIVGLEGVHPRRRLERDAGRLAARGGKGAGGRRALVRARARAAARSTSTPTRATRCTAASRPRRPSATRRWRGRSARC